MLSDKNTSYDIVIIGGGMSGLSCANILTKEGKKVIVLEKNQQVGGNLQIFSRDNCVFDTGVHYLGGLSEGEVLHKMFTYFGVLDKLELLKMDESGFDHIHFGTEASYYKYGMGFNNFENILINDFPEEINAIKQFTAAIKDVAGKLPLAQLRFEEENNFFNLNISVSASEFISGLTKNRVLRKVLGATNMLHAGDSNTPFYVHALVLYYYIESSYRCVGGSVQIAKQMIKQIKLHGGEVLNKSEVSKVNYEAGKIISVTLTTGKEIYGRHFISSLHPSLTVDIFGVNHFRKNYVSRVKSLQNSGSIFMLHLVFKENSFSYINHNIYQINNDDVWKLDGYTEETWPTYYMFTITPQTKNDKYAYGATVLSGMGFEELETWTTTHNTVLHPSERGSGYEQFKIKKAEQLIKSLEINFPDIRSKIKSYTTSTPLTIRDYSGSPNGTAYGIRKTSENPFSCFINPKTDIPNLYLTGQSLYLHGILGVALTAIETCSCIVDKKQLINKINLACQTQNV